MNTILDDLKDFDAAMDKITNTLLETQIKCMLLLQGGCQLIQADEVETGLAFIEFTEILRGSLNAQKEQVANSFDEAEIQRSYKRTNYYQKLYSAVTDAVLDTNAIYFDLAPRPKGAEYMCDTAACQQKIAALIEENRAAMQLHRPAPLPVFPGQPST